MGNLTPEKYQKLMTDIGAVFEGVEAKHHEHARERVNNPKAEEEADEHMRQLIAQAFDGIAPLIADITPAELMSALLTHQVVTIAASTAMVQMVANTLVNHHPSFSGTEAEQAYNHFTIELTHAVEAAIPYGASGLFADTIHAIQTSPEEAANDEEG